MEFVARKASQAPVGYGASLQIRAIQSELGYLQEFHSFGDNMSSHPDYLFHEMSDERLEKAIVQLKRLGYKEVFPFES